MRVRARKVEIDGIVFDSAHESEVYLALKLQQRSGLISKLQCHPKFVFEVNGVRICSYKPDFTYIDKENKVRVVDAKGFKKSKKTGKLLPRVDRDFHIRRKFLLAQFGIEVEIV